MTRYRTVPVDGLDIFYREAGPADAPVLLLLHGFPSSSRMYEPLLSRLAGSCRLIAPDYPGFGHSSAPAVGESGYTFDRLAEVMCLFTDALVLDRYTLFVQDYGGPVGFRMAVARAERLDGLIIQNAVAHDSGLGPLWRARRAFWAGRAGHEAAAYPVWQAWLRRHRPRTLVLWGRHDASFQLSEAGAYRPDVPDARVHVLDGGHFVLDTCADEVAELVKVS